MAKLIPSFVDERTPQGERDVFNFLAAGPDDWVVLHALDIAPWNRGLRTEIDFVVIIPDTGILCVEVKSHDFIEFENGRWSPPSIKRSPFKQVIDATQAFYRRLRDVAPQFVKVPVVHGCIFPRASFSLAPNLSVQPWELMDARVFRAFREAEAFCADLRARAQKSIATDKNITPLARALTKAQVDQIALFCHPVHKNKPGTAEEIRQREKQAEEALRAQQKPVLQMVNQNDRIVVTGGAGTGKTHIAMEVARRAADRGDRVALLCFNRLVGEWMQAQLAPLVAERPNLVVGRAIQVMATMTGIQPPKDASTDYWNNIFPLLLEERLTDPDFRAAAAFDLLVLDEAQDVFGRAGLWECLKQFLAGGLENGRFFVCGDFEHQVLGQREVALRNLSTLDAVRPARWHLTENCRNYKIVGDTAVALSGFTKPVYTDYMRVGGGIRNFDISYYDDEKSQLNRLAALLKEFLAAGYRPSDISVLSFRSDDKSAAGRLKETGLRVRPAQLPGDAPGYCSVHAFKGMESKIVILTDALLSDVSFQRDIFYTGMTRATETVRVLCAKESQRILLKWLTGGIAT